MKFWAFGFFLIFGQFVFAQNKCGLLVSQSLDIARRILEPPYRKNCQITEVSNECKSSVERWNAQGLNWKSYAKECAVVQNTGPFGNLLPCLGFLEDLFSDLQSDLHAQIENDLINEECSKDQAQKKQMLDEFNQGKPKLIRIDDVKLQQQLLKKDCRSLNNFLKGHLRNRISKLSFLLNQVGGPSVETPEQKEFLVWSQSQIQKKVQSDDVNIFEILSRSIDSFKCMAPQRQARYVCEVAMIGRSAFKNLSRIKRPKLKRTLTDEEKLKLEEKLWKEFFDEPDVEITGAAAAIKNNPKLVAKMDHLTREIVLEIAKDGNPVEFIYGGRKTTGIIKGVKGNQIQVRVRVGVNIEIPLDTPLGVPGY